MKLSIAIFLMTCLQVAISPLCLCFGAEVEEEIARLTCCHAPEGSEPAPCPHCDQELPLTAPAPAKADFGAGPPEWNGLEMFFGTDQFAFLDSAFPDPVSFRVLRDAAPPPVNLQAWFGVFLI